MKVNNKAKLIRREIFRHLGEMLIKETPFSETDRIPIKMRPKNQASIRCCIYRDRAVIRHKTMAMLGFDTNIEQDELKPLGEYFQESLNTAQPDDNILTVTHEACSSCKKANYVVTNMCRGCVGQSCMLNCPKDAIAFIGNQAKILEDKCVNCGLCQKVCPYHSIIYSPVPCEEVCPVDAIQKDAHGKEVIDIEKCIFCGKCIESCPYGAIVEKSHLFNIINKIKQKKKMIAMVAPSIGGQFRENMEKIMGSLIKLGFSEVYEVAMGADITAKAEANEFMEKAGEGLSMTTSCCPAYVNFIDKHAPDLKPYVSTTHSPMEYTAQYLREQHPEKELVFISPCIGKKDEASRSENIDYVINFEEFGAWLIAAGIEISECEDYSVKENISSHARGFAWNGGVSQAVAVHLPTLDFENIQFNGIERRFERQLKTVLKSSKPALVEVMSCEGGCLGGCSSIVNEKAGRRQLEKFIGSLRVATETV